MRVIVALVVFVILGMLTMGCVYPGLIDKLSAVLLQVAGTVAVIALLAMED